MPSTITPSKTENETNPTQGPTDTDIAKAPTTTTETSRDNNFTNPKGPPKGPYYKRLKYKTGGLNTQTGPAWLDGTFAKPELVLNSKDTTNFLELRDLLRALQISIKSPHRDLTDNNKNNGDNYYEIDINVESIADDYDVAKMADKIKKLISQDALYRNGNAINRLR